jgi:hypothetical protein
MPDHCGHFRFPSPAGHQSATTILLFFAALAALLLVTWFVYHPGITGVFLLDDFSNLQTLGTWGPVTHRDALWRYLTSGIADPTGRPLSLLSFLLDAQDWPATTMPFKVTNILLHMLNGSLLCWTMLKLARRRGIPERRAAMAALIGSGIWLLHPLFVSTTLYVVQREAMLPATFTFIGMICWCSGRDAFDAGKTKRAFAWMLSGAWGCTLLATLCKANGILLPLLLVATEVTVMQTPGNNAAPGQRTQRNATLIVLGLPLAILAAYLAYLLPGAIHTSLGAHGWTVGQRLLSEPRILTGYLRLLWVPQTTSFGVFNDQIHASTGWLEPWTTLPCVIFIGSLIVAGIFARRRFPVLAFAILFYFAGQLLESSFIPLELAFEHRNYLPAAFMFWPVGLWLTAPRTRPLVGRAVAVALLCGLAAMTWTRAGVWGNLQLQARLWGHINPDSPQAQSFSAAVEAATGNMPAALARLRSAAIRMPDQPQLALTLISTECQADAIDPQSWQLALHSLQHTSTGWNNVANWFLTTIPDAMSHRCRGLTLGQLATAFAAVKSNPKFVRWHSHDIAFRRVDAVFFMANGHPQRALAAFDSILADYPSPGRALEQSRSLNAFDYPKPALHHLDYFAALPVHTDSGIGMPRIHAWVLHKQGWWSQQIMDFRKHLEANVTTHSTMKPRRNASSQAAPASSPRTTPSA